MNVLGICGKECHAAAAVSIDGVVAAAAAEESFARVRHIGYRHTGGYPLSAIAACLTRAGLTAAEIDRLIVVDDERAGTNDPRHDSSAAAGRLLVGANETLEHELRTRPHEWVVPALADARQLTAVCQDEDLRVIVLGAEAGESAIFERRGARLTPLPGAHRLFCAIRRIADALGLGASARYNAIERLGTLSSGQDSALSERVITWEPEHGFVLNDEELERVIVPLQERATAFASDTSLNMRLQEERRALAATFSARVTGAVIDMAGDLAARAGLARVGLTGSLLSSRGLATGLARALGDAAVVAAVPDAGGRAIGAALVDGDMAAAPLPSLALGPEFSEKDIKLALENCRLDYVYEPDWSRLLARISRMLSHGSVVGWFQGPLGFGPRPADTRGILCDPANRYARENINRFLRQASIDEPLPVSMTATAMRDCLETPATSRFVTLDAPVKEEWRDRLRASLDQRQAIPVQMVTEDQSPTLFRLLEIHRERSGVPGLINTRLCGMNEPTACTPRDAVRTVFSSAIDALVIGRFLLMKDYWLLRSTADA